MVSDDSFVSFKTACVLKEKGFNMICRSFYKDWRGKIVLYECNRTQCMDYCNNSSLKCYNDDVETNIAAPSLELATKWLRKEHNITIDIYFEVGRIIYTVKQEGKFITSVDTPRPYEDAIDEAIKYCCYLI